MYRQGRLRCPGCGSPMESQQVDRMEVTIDACDRCGCVYLEYFDGEPAALARALRAMRRGKREAVVVAPRSCPECGGGLALRPYLEEGPELYRCQACMGVIATPAMLTELARWMPARPEEEAEKSLWARLRSALGMKR